MKSVLIINCSNSETSINRIASLLLMEKINSSFMDIKDYSVELYNFSNEHIFPHKIYDFINELNKYEILIFFTPEHNGYLPAFFKNILDWASRSKHGIDYLKNKEAVIVTATPGKLGGANVRQHFGKVIQYTGVKLLGSIGIAEYDGNKNIDKELNEIINLIK